MSESTPTVIKEVSAGLVIKVDSLWPPKLEISGFISSKG